MGGDGRMKKLASQQEASDIPRIVKELKAAAQDGKEKNAHLLDVLAQSLDEANVAAMVKAGAIGPLVGLVAQGTDGGQIHAASTLASIAAGQRENQMQVVKAGAITPLVVLLRSGSEKAQMHAAHALASLSEDHDHQKPIIKAGAINPLVRLVRVGIDDAKVHASSAIANLADQNPEAQAAIFAGGATPLLLQMLHSGKSQTSAANALAKLLSPAPNDVTPIYAASAPANVEVQEAVWKEGGIAPLLALLNGVNIAAQVNAAAALANLARGNAEAQSLIARAGGIGPILALLPSRNSQAQAQGANALAQVARFHRENQDSIARMGGLPLLVSLLQSSSPLEVQAMAALALTEICRNNYDNQSSTAELGSISSLVIQLRGGERGGLNHAHGTPAPWVDEVKAEAAGAVWVLSQDHVANKVAIAKAGGIPPTVSLLATGGFRGLEHAGHALATLGLDNVDNQIQITTLLVGLLLNGSADAKVSAAASLWRLVQENPESQQAIATAGPTSDLIGLLKDGTKGAKAYALWSLSLSINETNQRTLLEEDAVESLVSEHLYRVRVRVGVRVGG